MLEWRLWFAKAMARVEMSIPRTEGYGMCGERRAWRRRAIQPVPVQRSRIRKVVGRGEEGEGVRKCWSRTCTRWVV